MTELVDPPKAQEQTAMDIKEVMSILPHRYPFLLVDKVLELDLEAGVVVAQKNCTINEQFFQGHFPGVPLMPGVLILEALAQAGAIMVNKKTQCGRLGVLLGVNNGKFRRPVRPGDTLILRCELLHASRNGGRCKGIAMVDGRMAAQAEITFSLVDSDTI